MNWWARQDSNLQPLDYESTALTIELRAHGEKKGNRFRNWSPGQDSNLQHPAYKAGVLPIELPGHVNYVDSQSPPKKGMVRPGGFEPP